VEDNIMKKVLTLLAMALMIVGLSGCMDDPDGSKQKVSSSIQL
jgi:starvation-inducible outer membrane lipoprotein